MRHSMFRVLTQIRNGILPRGRAGNEADRTAEAGRNSRTVRALICKPQHVRHKKRAGRFDPLLQRKPLRGTDPRSVAVDWHRHCLEVLL
jgi:hypothetical protein